MLAYFYEKNGMTSLVLTPAHGNIHVDDFLTNMFILKSVYTKLKVMQNKILLKLQAKLCRQQILSEEV